MTEIPEHITRLEALYAAMQVRYARLPSEKVSALRHAVVGHEKTRLALQVDGASRDDLSEHLRGNMGEYTEEGLRFDVLEASTQYHNLLQLKGGQQRAEQYLAKAAQEIHGKALGRDQHAAMRAGTYQPPVGPFGGDAGRFLDADHYDAMHQQVLTDIARQAAESGYISAQAQRTLADLAAGLAAVGQDVDGAYDEARRIEAGKLGRERLARDHPPQGRRLVYVGDHRPEDGNPGLLEVFALLGGNDEHLDSAGENSPLHDPTYRSYLQNQARQLGLKTEVHEPLARVVPERQWENVHFVGLMPKSFTAANILRPIAPGGTGTMEVEPNAVGENNLVRSVIAAIAPTQEVYDQMPHRFPYAGQFDHMIIPTRVVRVLNEPSGRLGYSLDHQDPELEGWEEHALVLFHRNPDGSSNALYEHLREQQAQKNRAR